VLPDVLVAPLAVAEADHRVDLREEDAEGAGIEERVEAELGILAHHHAIQARAHSLRVEARRGLEVLRGDRLHDLDELSLLRRDRRQLEGVHGAIGVAGGRLRGLLRARIGGFHGLRASSLGKAPCRGRPP
jgi:hypothetical protein